ncbi:MAG: sulfurtransferase [Algicola sp.]|nr:sulfurtransferase [Algicola sp.]
MNTLISVSWLKAHLNDENVIVLNATLPKATAIGKHTETQQIPNARYFDIKTKFSDVRARFPNTLPSAEQFNQETQNLGINKDSVIVVYDDYGFYSSARAWWLLKAFGHMQVAVLNGGLPEWKQAGFPLEKKQSCHYEKGDFSGALQPAFFQFFNDIEGLKDNPETLILDARSKDRFEGSLPEPREGLRSGHIPSSVNLPFQELLSGNTMTSMLELKTIFHKLNPENKNMVFTCGSGVTACILALGAELSGYKNLSVYDGSWTEYGSLKNA